MLTRSRSAAISSCQSSKAWGTPRLSAVRRALPGVPLATATTVRAWIRAKRGDLNERTETGADHADAKPCGHAGSPPGMGGFRGVERRSVERGQDRTAEGLHPPAAEPRDGPQAIEVGRRVEGERVDQALGKEDARVEARPLGRLGPPLPEGLRPLAAGRRHDRSRGPRPSREIGHALRQSPRHGGQESLAIALHQAGAQSRDTDQGRRIRWTGARPARAASRDSGP